MSSSVAESQLAELRAQLELANAARRQAEERANKAEQELNQFKAKIAAIPPASSSASSSLISSTVTDSSSAPATSRDLSESASALLDFLLIVGRCKLEKRTGWVNGRVPLPESVADHMYRMSVMALTCLEYDPATASSATSSDGIDPFRAVQVALVHDLAEAIVGDITPTQYSGVTKAAKHELELNAMETIRDKLRRSHLSPFIAEHVYQCWLEYENGQTATAKYVKNLDKLDMYLQAYEYQLREVTNGTPDGNSIDPSSLVSRLNRFYASVDETRSKIDAQDEKVQHQPKPQQLIHAVLKELETRREAMLEQGKKTQI